MFQKRSYFIKIQRSNCLVRSNGKTITFNFGNKEILRFESEISDYCEFEMILKHKLKKLNYKSLLWNKNALYFSIPNNLDHVQMRCYFDSADHVDATETYLLHENIAILINKQFEQIRNKSILLVGVFASKIELSIINNLEIKKNEAYYFSKKLQHYPTSRTILNFINKFKEGENLSEMLLINDKNDNLLIELRKEYPSFNEIRNREELILNGLELAANEKLMTMINRVKL